MPETASLREQTKPVFRIYYDILLEIPWAGEARYRNAKAGLRGQVGEWD